MLAGLLAACAVKRESEGGQDAVAPEEGPVISESNLEIETVVTSPPSVEVIADLTGPRTAERKQFPFLKADGPFIVDENGQPVVLRGCNLGNWFLLEMWMLDNHDLRDQHQFISILKTRFGNQTASRLMDLYRENWIAERDFEIIRRFGFNVVRVPFHYSLLENDDRPMSLRSDAFQWLDRAVQLASNAGMYVILDLHGAAGGQSDDHTTGKAGQNRLWKDESFQRRFIWLWREISAHFKDQPVVAAYDLLNEPYGVKTEAEHRRLVAVMDAAIRAIRAQGDQHLIFVPGTHSGFAFYGAPTKRLWTNVGFTEHYYPGLFGSPPTKESHAHFISRKLPAVSAQQRDFDAPMLVGEFNVVWDSVGGAALMRHYYDLYAGYGWAATMWAYKLVKSSGGTHKDSWSMVVNRDPAPHVDIRTASLETIESYFRWFGNMTYTINDKLLRSLTMEPPPPISLPALDPVLTVAPAQEPLDPWQCTDIGNALPGGQKRLANGGFEIYGGGADIWAYRDDFRYVWQKVVGDFQISATVAALSNTHVYAKAGLMIRESLAPDSPHVLLHVFPNGQTLVAWRDSSGGTTKQKNLRTDPFPINLTMIRQGSKLELFVSGTSPGSGKTNVVVRLSDSLRGPAHIGLAVLSHDNTCLTTAVFQDVRFKAGYGTARRNP